jgi:ribosomal protein L44E
VRRGDWEEEWFVLHLLRGLQNIENEEECSDMEKREESSGLKSQRRIERQEVGIEGTERRAEDVRRADEKRQNRISMR